MVMAPVLSGGGGGGGLILCNMYLFCQLQSSLEFHGIFHRSPWEPDVN